MAVKPKFGPDGLRLLPELREITDINVLENMLQSVDTASTLEDLRQTYAG